MKVSNKECIITFSFSGSGKEKEEGSAEVSPKESEGEETKQSGCTNNRQKK